MPNLACVSVPLSRIDRIEVYINKSPRKTVTKIKESTGADYILNGTLYNMTTGEVVCHLKADGKVICAPPYQVEGYAWNSGSDFCMKLLPNIPKGQTIPEKNFIACSNLIIDGKLVEKPCNDPARQGKRGRSAIGIKDGCLTLYCSKDGSNSASTPEQLQDELAADGWESAVMLDGGGSSQCDFDGLTVTSSRKVQHLILVYLKKEPTGDDNMVNAYSKAKDGDKKLSNNFKVREFACNDGSDPVFISPELVKLLQEIRDHFGKPVTINSGFRTATKNKAVGGATYSQHLYGMAADITVKGIAPKTVAAYAEKLLPNTGGIGIYGTFTHVDVRATKSRWNG